MSALGSAPETLKLIALFAILLLETTIRVTVTTVYHWFPFPVLLDYLFTHISWLRRCFSRRLEGPKHNPALKHNFSQFVREAGYNVEEHYVSTADGFCLVLHRIVPSTTSTTKSSLSINNDDVPNKQQRLHQLLRHHEKVLPPGSIHRLGNRRRGTVPIKASQCDKLELAELVNTIPTLPTRRGHHSNKRHSHISTSQQSLHSKGHLGYQRHRATIIPPAPQLLDDHHHPDQKRLSYSPLSQNHNSNDINRGDHQSSSQRRRSSGPLQRRVSLDSATAYHKPKPSASPNISRVLPRVGSASSATSLPLAITRSLNPSTEDKKIKEAGPERFWIGDELNGGLSYERNRDSRGSLFSFSPQWTSPQLQRSKSQELTVSGSLDEFNGGGDSKDNTSATAIAVVSRRGRRHTENFERRLSSNQFDDYTSGVGNRRRLDCDHEIDTTVVTSRNGVSPQSAAPITNLAAAQSANSTDDYLTSSQSDTANALSTASSLSSNKSDMSNSDLSGHRTSSLCSDATTITNSRRQRRPPVLLMHGLMMTSEVFVVDRSVSLAFKLVDEGYDVWLGNNRGNKYSWMHRYYKRKDAKYWDFSIDELARYDIPALIKYTLNFTGWSELSYIGFSNGTAQMFAALASDRDLNSLVNLFIALAPACKIKKLNAQADDSFSLFTALLTSSSRVFHLFFGRLVMLPTVEIWRKILSVPLFTWLNDAALHLLFSWHPRDVDPEVREVFYHHLYSTSSTKVVHHWFQMLRSGSFEFYNDSGSAPGGSIAVPEYHIDRITVPVVLIHGGRDALSDVNWILNNIPRCSSVPIAHYEHLDPLIARDVSKEIFPLVLSALSTARSRRGPSSQSQYTLCRRGRDDSDSSGNEEGRELMLTEKPRCRQSVLSSLSTAACAVASAPSTHREINETVNDCSNDLRHSEISVTLSPYHTAAMTATTSTTAASSPDCPSLTLHSSNSTSSLLTTTTATTKTATTIFFDKKKQHHHHHSSSCSNGCCCSSPDRQSSNTTASMRSVYDVRLRNEALLQPSLTQSGCCCCAIPLTTTKCRSCHRSTRECRVSRGKKRRAFQPPPPPFMISDPASPGSLILMQPPFIDGELDEYSLSDVRPWRELKTERRQPPHHHYRRSGCVINTPRRQSNKRSAKLSCPKGSLTSAVNDMSALSLLEQNRGVNRADCIMPTPISATKSASSSKRPSVLGLAEAPPDCQTESTIRIVGLDSVSADLKGRQSNCSSRDTATGSRIVKAGDTVEANIKSDRVEDEEEEALVMTATTTATAAASLEIGATKESPLGLIGAGLQLAH